MTMQIPDIAFFITGTIFMFGGIFALYFMGAFITWDWILLSYFKEHTWIYLRASLIFGAIMFLVQVASK